MNKHKIINDPVYGFISIKTPLIYDLIEHPYFQRLRYIKQLGMTHLVYPGALNTRFHHALGAMHLMQLALEHLQDKGQQISPVEAEAAVIAILLHDIGHGPFSHALEHSLVEGISHEAISQLFMGRLNEEFNGTLDLALQIFNNQYEKPFLHQLVSGQLDLDRLDYLNRDSFFSGVTEGMVSSDRIIKLLNVKDGQLVVEEKGVYSIEKFLIARRLMYWQVYLHKAVIAAEMLLVNILKRARELAKQGAELFASPAFKHFLYQDVGKDFGHKHFHLEQFALLDDHDVMSAVKVWQKHPDFVLSFLCQALINRKLYKVKLGDDVPSGDIIEGKSEALAQHFGLDKRLLPYFIFTDSINNMAYKMGTGSIRILRKNGDLEDIAAVSDNSNLEALSKVVTKKVLCYVKI